MGPEHVSQAFVCVLFSTVSPVPTSLPDTQRAPRNYLVNDECVHE